MMVDLLLGLLVLIVIEVILSIDNLIFLSVLTARLPPGAREKARFWGLLLALFGRLLLLGLAMGVSHLTTPWFWWGDWSISSRDVFLLLGGGFLIVKATQEIHREVEPEPCEEAATNRKPVSFAATVLQVVAMDGVFSLDSILTAVGLTSSYGVMAIAISVAMMVMLYASGPVSHFIMTHPTIKLLAFSFLLMIGVVLIADGLAFHIPRGYLYFAMGFSFAVEGLQLIKKANRRV